MSVLAGLAAGGAIGALNIGGSYLGSRLAETQSKQSQKRAINYQVRYDDWYANNIYPQYQALDYIYAKRYAENSAKWEVQGLKNAGLNPLLAVSNGLSGAGVGYSAPTSTSGSVPSGNSFGSPDFKVDLAEAVRDFASADVADTQAQVAKDTASSLVSSAKSDSELKKANVGIADATKAKIDAERRQIEANTARTDLETRKLEESGGLKSPWLHDFSILGQRHAPTIMRNLSQDDGAHSAKSAADHDEALQKHRIKHNTELLQHGGQSGSMLIYTR